MGNDQKLDWIQELLEISQQFRDDGQFLDVVKSDFDLGAVFYFYSCGRSQRA